MNYVRSEKFNGKNIRVANMSLGYWVPQNRPINSADAIALKALSDAGIICVMAVGNENQNLSNPLVNPYDGTSLVGLRFYPACFKFENTISVGAVDSNDVRSIWGPAPNTNLLTGSNYGSAWVDIAAPGSSIFTTTMSGGYGAVNGTSISAPFVAGAAAILAAAYPNESASQIRARILHGARNVGVSSGLWAHGILDVWNAYRWPIVTTTALREATVGVWYSQALNANGLAPMTWSRTGGNLPQGLTLHSNGIISGTPAETGTFNFVVRATNAVGSVTNNMSITVWDGFVVSGKHPPYFIDLEDGKTPVEVIVDTFPSNHINFNLAMSSGAPFWIQRTSPNSVVVYGEINWGSPCYAVAVLECTSGSHRIDIELSVWSMVTP
jgi:subtilisin family serine protease